MTTSKYLFKIGMLVCFGLFYFTNAFAATCSGTPTNTTIGLEPANISVGPDTPDGTVIYRMQAGDQSKNSFLCNAANDESWTVAYFLKLTNAPLPLSSWSGSPFGGAVYETNVPGIGVAVWYNFNAITVGSPYKRAEATYTGNTTVSPLQSFDISFIKIGPVSPGTVQGASLPKVEWEVNAVSPNLSGLPLALRYIDFTGAVNITVPSCQTPDVTVNMGTEEIRTSFNGVGSQTQWVNADFSLINCPVFYGNFNNTRFPAHNNSNDSVTVPDSVPNTFDVIVAPFTDVVDAPNGIFKIDTSIPDSATGVAIQLGIGDAVVTPFNISSPYSYTTNNSGASTIVVPFKARYIQTERVITPGKANGKISVTINYK